MLKYRNHEEKTEAFSAVHNFAVFLEKYGYSENAKRLEENLYPFIAKIPVAEQNPCRY